MAHSQTKRRAKRKTSRSHPSRRVQFSRSPPPSDDEPEENFEQIREEEAVRTDVRPPPLSAARVHTVDRAATRDDVMQLENDNTANRQGTTAAGIFQKTLPNLTTPLGGEPNFTAVTDLLFGEGLITKPVLDGIRTQPTLTDSQRGSKVAHKLLDKIKASDDPVHCLLKICTVLEDEKVEDDVLKKHGANIREQLHLQPHEDNNGQQQQLVVPMPDEAAAISLIPPDNYQNRFTNAMEFMIQGDRDLTAVAEELRSKFKSLEIDVKNCLKSKPQSLLDAKRLVRRTLSDSCACRPEVMQQYRDELRRINDEEELFDFLCDHSFVSYLNYRLLEEISSKLADRKIRRKFDAYKKEYTSLLKCASFDKIIFVFESVPNLKPAAIIGFPTLKLRVERKKLYNSLFDFLDSVKLPPSVSHISDIGFNCIIITFSVFPSALLDLLNYLKDPVNIKRLQTNEVSVTLELPDTDINETCQVLIEQITANDKQSSVINILWTSDSSIVAIEATPTSQVLRKFNDRLSQLAFPMELVQLLYTEGVISMEILHDVVTRLSSLKELCTTVKPAVLTVLGTVLLKSEVSVPLANDILRYCGGDSQQSSDSVTQFFFYSRSTEGVSSDIDSGDTEAQSLQELYSSLISSVRPFIADFMVQVIEFLSCVFQEMRPQLVHAKTTDDVLQLIEENCSIENICCLETVIDHYDIKAAKVRLEAYKAKVNELFEQTNIGDCLNVSFRFSSSPHLLLKCDTVEFHLSLQFLQRPLKEIRVLLSKLFNGFANRVLMESIHQMEESIVVKCSAPHLLMGVFQFEVNKSLDELMLDEFLSLNVGYSHEKVALKKKVETLEVKLYETSASKDEMKPLLKDEQKMSNAEVVRLQLNFNWFQSSKLAVKKIVDKFGTNVNCCPADHFSGYHYWLFLLIIVSLLLIILSSFFTVKGEVMYINKTVTGGIADSIVWPNQFFKMEILPDSFPNTHSVDISVSLDSSHHLDTPKGYKSISQTYKITASEKLQKPVLLTLKHNGVIRSNEEARSVAVLHQSEGRSTVEMLQGTAAINSSYVVFQLTELSWITIIASVTTHIDYWVTFHRRQVSRGKNQYRILVLLSLDRRKIFNDWTPDDFNNDIGHRLTIGQKPIQKFKIQSTGCWVTRAMTDVDHEIKISKKSTNGTLYFLMKWRFDCTDPLSSIKLYDPENDANLYEIFRNPSSPYSSGQRDLMIISIFIVVYVIPIFIVCQMPIIVCLVVIFNILCVRLRKLLQIWILFIQSAFKGLRQSKSLDITDLVTVLTKLRQGNFSSSKWKQLGLQLGLYMNTLDYIEMRCHERPHECLTECLSAWLRREDNTDGEGGAKWSSLKKALMDIGQKACADKIELY